MIKKLYYGLTNGTLLKDNNSILRRWAEYYSDLLNSSNPTDPTILDELPRIPTVLEMDALTTLEEVKKLSTHSIMAKLQAQMEYREKTTNAVTRTSAMLFYRYFVDAGTAARFQNIGSMQS